jgi:hypothetical protein
MDSDTFREEINTNDDPALASESYQAGKSSTIGNLYILGDQSRGTLLLLDDLFSLSIRVGLHDISSDLISHKLSQPFILRLVA